MDWFIEILRKLAGTIDYGIYSLADLIYRIFSAIANTEIINAEEISKFTNRVYVILGVFMLFKIGFSMLKYLVNPDTFTNQNTGYNKLIWNISTALVLLVSMPTIYNYAMRLQNAVISNNVIGKLILGTSGNGNAMETGGKKISFTVLSAFMMPNFDTMKDAGYSCSDLYSVDDDGNTTLNSACYKTLVDNVVEDSEAVEQYSKAITDSEVRDLVWGEHAPLMAHMKNDIHTSSGNSGNYTYFLQYRWGISSIVGLFLCFIFLTFCIDIAIRAVKIAFLMLISPIPILSMINPEKGAKGMLSKWFEMAWATYLDLFLRLASVYFVIYIITMVQTDVWGALVEAANHSIPVAVLAMVFIIIGALLFAKQLPDMIIKLFPMMDGIVKGGFNPLKKMADAPLVGKPFTAGAAKLNAMRAQAAANRKIQGQMKRNAAYEKARNAGHGKFASTLASTGVGRAVTGTAGFVKGSAESVKEKGFAQAAKDGAKSMAKSAAEGIKSAPKNLVDNVKSLHNDTRGVGAEVYDSMSWGGGDAKTSKVGGAAAKIRKSSAESLKAMKETSVKRAEDSAAYTKQGKSEGSMYSSEYTAKVEELRKRKAERDEANSAYEIAKMAQQAGKEVVYKKGDQTFTGEEAVNQYGIAAKKASGKYDNAAADMKEVDKIYVEDAKKRAAYEKEEDRRKAFGGQVNSDNADLYGANGGVISAPSGANVENSSGFVSATANRPTQQPNGSSGAQQPGGTSIPIYGANGEVISSGSTNAASGQPNVVNGGTTIVRTDDRNNDEPVGMTRQEVIEQNAAQTGPETNAQRVLRQSQVVTQQPIRVVNGGHELGQETSNVIMQVNNVTAEYRQVEQQLNLVTENINTRLRDIENVTAQVASETGAAKVAGEQELQRMRADLENMRSKQLDLMKQSEQSLTQVTSQMNELRTKITELNDLGRQAEALVLQQQLNDLNDIYNKRTEN